MSADERRGRRQHGDDDLDESDPLSVHVKYLRRDVDNCVTREEFAPVKAIVYGLLGILATSLISGLIGAWVLLKR